jgi:peptidoglycan hydrolase-like protein with peptidoglycan-binding domain
LQRRLKQLGYLPPNFAINGIYDAETQAAVRTFQRVNGLTENGIVDAATWQAIYNATQPQPTPPVGRQMRVNAGDSIQADAFSGPGPAPEYRKVATFANGTIVTTTGRVTGNWTELQDNMWIFSQWLQPL